jgi:hypothetical protein
MFGSLTLLPRRAGHPHLLPPNGLVSRCGPARRSVDLPGRYSNLIRQLDRLIGD